jgi:hypothetical protein
MMSSLESRARRSGGQWTGLSAWMVGLGALVAGSAPPCPAQQLTEIRAAAGFQDHVKLGTWAPIHVVLNNARGPAGRGEIVIPRQPANPVQESRIPVDLPAASRRAFTLYIRYRVQQSPIRVELRLRGGKTLTADAPCSPHSPDSRIVLVVSRLPGGLSFVGAVPLPPEVSTSSGGGPVARDSAVAYRAPDPNTGDLGLPDHPAGYSSVDVVVLRDISPNSFQPGEQEALTEWVRSGGLLVVVAGPNAAEMRGSFVEELGPVRIAGQRSVPSLAEFAGHFRAPIGPGEALVADVSPKPDADVVAAQEGVPILVSHAVDNGNVVFCAADSAAPPLRDADRLLLSMWADILQNASRARPWHPPGADPDAHPGGLYADTVRLPVMRWNAFAAFGGFLIAYIAFLVPLNRLVLRKADRREWTGWAALLFILLFSAGAVYLATQARLSASQACEAGIARAQSGSKTAWLDGVVGIRSANASRLALTPSNAADSIEPLITSRRVARPVIDEERGFSLPAAATDLWGYTAYRVEGPTDLGGRVTAELVSLDGENLAVVVTNRTSYPLRRAFVLTSTPHPIEDIAPDTVRQCGPIPVRELRATNASAMSGMAAALTKHSDGADGRGASPDQRIRSRIITQLTGVAPAGQPSRSRYSSMSGGPPYGSSGGPQPALTFSQPMLGAWISLPAPLLDLAPPPRSRISEVLLLVEVPVNVSLPLLGAFDFGPLDPIVQWNMPGISQESGGKIEITSGSHEMQFRLPPPFGNRRAERLSITLGCDRPGLKAEVLNYRTAAWELLQARPGRTTSADLTPPNDYIRWPGGQVRVRLSRSQPSETRVTCTASGSLGP